MTDQGRRLFVWLARHHAEAELLHDVPSDVVSRLWADAEHEGAWDAIHQNTQLGLDLTHVVERLEELANLYREHEIEREAERKSVYWRTEAAEELPSPCELDPDHEFHQHEVKA